MSEGQIRALCTSLESYIDNPPFSKVLRGNDCIPLVEREACSSTSSTSNPKHSTHTEDNRSNNVKDDSTVNSNMAPNSVEQDLLESFIDEEMNPETNSASTEETVLSTEEAVFVYVSVNQIEAERIQVETKEQSKSSAWYKECQCRITTFYFGRVCKIRQTTPGNKLATTITSQCNYNLPHWHVLGEKTMSHWL